MFNRSINNSHSYAADRFNRKTPPHFVFRVEYHIYESTLDIVALWGRFENNVHRCSMINLILAHSNYPQLHFGNPYWLI